MYPANNVLEHIGLAHIKDERSVKWIDMIKSID